MYKPVVAALHIALLGLIVSLEYNASWFSRNEVFLESVMVAHKDNLFDV